MVRCPSSAALAAPSGNSALWNQFVQARRSGTEPTLPDFSYAGYKRSDAPIPNVAYHLQALRLKQRLESLAE